MLYGIGHPNFGSHVPKYPTHLDQCQKKTARLSASHSASSRWCCWAFGPPAPRSTGVLLGEEEKHTEAARLAFPGCKGTFGHHSGEASRPIAVEVPYLRRIAILHIFLVRVRLLSGLSLEEGNDWMWGCARGLGFEGFCRARAVWESWTHAGSIWRLIVCTAPVPRSPKTPRTTAWAPSRATTTRWTS